MSVSLDEEFQKFRPQLRSFVLRMCANVDDTDDVVQATFVRATEKLHTFKGTSSIKTWVFAIAVNLVRNHLRSKRSWPVDATDIGQRAALAAPDFMAEMMAVHESVPGGAFEIREHISMCFTCVAKTLPIDQQIAVLLKEVYALTVAEIADIIESSEGVVKHLLVDGRGTMTEIFDRRCALISKHGICHQCSQLSGVFNPKHEAQQELLQISLTRDAASRSRQELIDLRSKLVAGVDPFLSRGAKLTLLHLEHTRSAIESADGNQHGS